MGNSEDITENLDRNEELQGRVNNRDTKQLWINRELRLLMVYRLHYWHKQGKVKKKHKKVQEKSLNVDYFKRHSNDSKGKKRNDESKRLKRSSKIYLFINRKIRVYWV